MKGFENMKLQFSKNELPYLVFDNFKLIFAKETSTETHYKYVVFSGKTKIGYKLKGKTIYDTVPINFMTDFTFTKVPTDVKKSIGKSFFDKLNIFFKKYTDVNGFPKRNITMLAADVNKD